MLNIIAYLFGTFLVLQFMKDLIYVVYVLFFSKNLDLKKIYGSDSYVLITGGSKGIGFGFAKEFASRGFNLILVARNSEDLKQAKTEIEKKYSKCKCLVRSFDFATLNELESFEELSKSLDLPDNIDISILVNNVGIANRRRLNNTLEEEIKKVITVNCLSQVLVTELLLKKFEKRNNASCIINVGSMSSKKPLPWFDLYGATKSTNQYYNTSSLCFKKVDSYLFSPAFVATQLSRTKQNFFKISVDESVQSAMKFVGRHRARIYGHWKHEILHFAFWILPYELCLGFAKMFLGKVQNK